MDLKQLFIQNFNMDRVSLDLMDLIDENTLNDFIINEFNDNFTYGELYELFKNYYDKDTLSCVLQDMGHDYIDLDSLNDKEKEKYF